METPKWIADIIAEHGGWFVPLQMSETHPLVAEAWECSYCHQPIAASDVAFVMPLWDGEMHHWISNHRTCVLKQMGLT